MYSNEIPNCYMCIDAHMNEYGKITNYKLVGGVMGVTVLVPATNLKQLMKNNKIQVVNMTLKNNELCITDGNPIHYYNGKMF